MTIIFYALGAVAVITLFWFLTGLKHIQAVSTGEIIGERSETALILIDLQTVFWERGPYFEKAKSMAKDAIVEEINRAKEYGYPIIAVRHEWSIASTKLIARMFMKGQGIEGTAGTELLDTFRNLADHELIKRVQDAFESGELDELLKRYKVGKLRLVGLDFNYCVQKTALAARNRCYEVLVIESATLASTSKERTLKCLSKHDVHVQ
ncbi:cysteine hydrolase [Terasakiella sp. A23]|uniref:cysteine hydrolase family protein n=1 Tax=Terasakiella sp. FCG-A23 TaxID=3080561 RepID=UPI002952CB47|nr:cysteine hydrolase [Terasakiella sp. A23]MDV7341056.1 cysteine hydrolase [Terasakiella sp. A23]